MTTVTAPPTLRLLRAPVSEPPYDDELPAHAPMVDGSLALAFPPTGEPVPLHLVPPAVFDDGFGPQPTARAERQYPELGTRRPTQEIAELLSGAWPPAQLARFTTLDVLEQLERSTGRLGRTANGTRAVTMRPVVASVHLSEPADGVAEACAVVDTGPRRRALALRLEGLDGRWRCTALQLG